MPRQAGVTDRAPKPVGPYSQSVRIGRLVHSAGQGADDPATGRLAGDDIETQTRQCLTNVRSVLEASGASMADVIRVGVFLAHKDDFEGMNRVYREFFEEPFPARTTVYVGLPGDLRVEIDALAVLPE
ncbi:MAG TPA: Rid family detoxifying hydrolase [Capillimicrobium sp.]|nr:Rid family detoxifying hydrolase [Capillimicrobium sp.]